MASAACDISPAHGPPWLLPACCCLSCLGKPCHAHCSNSLPGSVPCLRGCIFRGEHGVWILLKCPPTRYAVHNVSQRVIHESMPPICIHIVSCFICFAAKSVCQCWMDSSLHAVLQSCCTFSTHTNKLVGVMWRVLHGPKAVQ